MIRHIIKVDDQTTYQRSPAPEIQIGENILIVGTFQKGVTNRLMQFYPGEADRFVETFGAPNYHKYGIGPDIAVKALNNVDSDLGILAINIRPSNARYANAILVAKWKVLENVQKTNAEGDPLYITPAGVETVVAGGNTPITRDVLEYFFRVMNSNAIGTKADMYTEFDAPYSDTPDAQSYKTIPLFGFHYVGTGEYGNNLNFRMVEKESPYDGSILYDMELFNGNKYVSVNNLSLFPEATLYAGVSSYIENVMPADEFMKVQSSSHLDKFLELVKQYAPNPSMINLFDVDEYTIRTADNTLDITAPLAVTLASGSNGSGELAPLYKNFFDSKIVADLDSIIRYRIDIIPDLEYTTEVKEAIGGLLKRRTNTSSAITMLGTNTFESAIAERMTNYTKDDANTLFIAANQNPASYNVYTKRKLRLPAIYYTMCAYIDRYYSNKNSFYAFAGADVRWADFDEDSLQCSPVSEAFDKLLDDARINVVKMDARRGAYIASQTTNTERLSDRTEFNNMCILRSIIYRIANLVHENNYKFNDLEDVEKFQESIQLDIYPTFRGFVSGISAVVYKKGLTGADKNTNIITIKVNFKDLAKETETTIVLTDSTIE